MEDRMQNQLGIYDYLGENMFSVEQKPAFVPAKPSPKSIFTPHDYQRRAIDFIEEHHDCAVFLDCGLGKTPISLSVIKDLGEYPVLVIGPNLVIETVWIPEARKWQQFKDITFSSITGSVDRRRKALRTKAQVYLLSRDNLVWAKEAGLNMDKFKMIIIDESSSFKNPMAKRTQALFNLPHPRKVILSATPAPKNLVDLYSQFKILDGGRSLGRTLTQFRHRYMFKASSTKNIWLMRPGMEQSIYRDIAPITVSMRAEEYLKLPKFNQVPHIVYMSEQEQAVYRRMEKKAVLSVISEDGTVGKVKASNAAVLTSYLSQLSNGFLYDAAGKPVKLHSHKIDMLTQLMEEAETQGERIVVCYNFRADREAILKVCEERKLKVADLTTTDGVKQYHALQFDVAILHPRSAGMGLNLQKESRTLIWYSLPWSYEDYYQTISRIYRQGQEKPVFIHTILMNGSVDANIVKALNCKKGCDDALKASTKAIIRKYKKEAA